MRTAVFLASLCALLVAGCTPERGPGSDSTSTSLLPTSPSPPITPIEQPPKFRLFQPEK